MIGENDVDEDLDDGLVDDPDDEAAGGKIIFNFDEPVSVLHLDAVDIEEEGGSITGYDAGNSEVFSKAIAIFSAPFEPIKLSPNCY